MPNNEPIRYAFSKAANNNGEPEQLELMKAVHQECPDLLIKGKEPTWAEYGFFGHVAFVGDYVIKSPKFKNTLSLHEFDEECAYLEKLKDIDLAPNVIHIGEHFNFCVMQRMPGELLAKVPDKKIKKHKERIIATLVKFSHDLAKALPIEDYPEEKTFDKEFILSETEEIQEQFTTPYFQKTLGEARYREYSNLMRVMEQFYTQNKPVMCHADLKDDNILVNPKDPGEITGVIDFGVISKCVSPEVFFGLRDLGVSFNSLFSKAYRPHKSNFNVLDASKALSNMRFFTEFPDDLTNKDFAQTDDLVAQCKMPSA